MLFETIRFDKVKYSIRSRGNSVSIVIRLRAWWPDFNSRQGHGYFLLFTITSRLAL